jgi:hypothetical protein
VPHFDAATSSGACLRGAGLQQTTSRVGRPSPWPAIPDTDPLAAMNSPGIRSDECVSGARLAGQSDEV